MNETDITVLPDIIFFENKPTLFTLQVRKILEVLHIKNSLPGDKLWTFASAILINASKIKENWSWLRSKE